jgi:predicted transcriptional regulator of viral defense system
MDGAVLTLASAAEAGLRKDEVYALVESGELEKVGRGVFVDPERIDPAWASLAAATALKPEATLCLTSALVHHQLSDAIPFATDIALPRGARHPAGFDHVSWHSFDPDTFDLGRTLIEQDGLPLAIYSADRTIIDAFRLAHREGADQAHEALRRWVRRRGNQPATLLDLATSFPKAKPRIRHALEVLL